MNCVIFTTIRSPHLLPFAKELSKQLGNENFRYIYTMNHDINREDMGWIIDDDTWCEYANGLPNKILESDYLMTSFRDCKLIEDRINKQRKTFYLSERWFKPPIGLFRLSYPKYYNIAKRICKYLQSPNFCYLAIGIHAARDMIRLYELLQEKKMIRIFTSPKVAFESRPGGAIIPLKEAINQNLLNHQDILFAKKNGFCQIPKENWDLAKPRGIYERIKIWGYFVTPSTQQNSNLSRKGVLWVGRLIPLKNTITLVKSCNQLQIPLDIYGDGPLKSKLESISGPSVHFHPFVQIKEIRNIMNSHKIYVLPSNAYEGWGAVISEALEEKMVVYASIESGAGATMLPYNHLFKFNDNKSLSDLLSQDNTLSSIGCWNAEYAAKYIYNLISNKKI